MRANPPTQGCARAIEIVCRLTVRLISALEDPGGTKDVLLGLTEHEALISQVAWNFFNFVETDGSATAPTPPDSHPRPHLFT